MIFINFISFIVMNFLTIISFSGLGQILTSKYNKSWIENIFFGFIFFTILITFLHFFFSISTFLKLTVFSIGLISFFKKQILQDMSLKKDFKFILIILIFLVPIYISQKFHEDFGYYHLPHIINLTSEKIIFGLANVNDGFIHNSIWLNSMSLFFHEKNYNLVNLPTFLLYSIFIFFCFKNIINDKLKGSAKYFLIICLFYLLLKFTRISEFGTDIPSLIFASLSIFNFLRYEDEIDIKSKEYFFFAHVSFCVFAILIKFSVIPILVFTIYIFFRDYKKLYKKIFRFNYFFIYIIFIIFFTQQFIYTGCFFFPSDITCLKVSWFNEYFIKIGDKLELINKSYFEAEDIITKKDFLKSFNWLPFWFHRNYLEFIEHLLTMISPILIFLLLLKDRKIISQKFKLYPVFICFIFVSFYYWIVFSPVYRFAIINFLITIFVISISFYQKRKFSKKLFLIFFSIFLFFNFNKNLVRIYNQEEIFFGIKKIENEYKEYNTNKYTMIKVFKPDFNRNSNKGNGWQGRLCWDIPFICSYNEIRVNSVNNYYIINRLN